MAGVVSRRQRAIGCLYGQAIGDALGTRYEFMPAIKAQTTMKKDTRKSDSFLPILGGGPFCMAVGQVTDDTEMAMGLLHSLLKCRRFDRENVARAYHDWYKSVPPDIGNTTQRALTGVNRSAENVYDQLVNNSVTHNGKSLSNGCLMRISPLAIAMVGSDEEKLRAAGRDDCLMTHSNPIAHDAVAVYLTGLHALLNMCQPQDAYDRALASATTPLVREILEKAADFETWKKDTRCDGFLGVGLLQAFAHMLHTDSFEQALLDTISLGGDTDTAGCIVGAMMGAKLGYHALPKEWRHTVVNANPNRLKRYPTVALKDLESYADRLLRLTVEEEADTIETSGKETRAGSGSSDTQNGHKCSASSDVSV